MTVVMETGERGDAFNRVEQMLEPVRGSLALQTFEYFDGRPEFAEEQRQAFLNGEIRNPVFEYPMLGENTIDAKKVDFHIKALNGAIDAADEYEDADVSLATWGAIGYRLAEAYFLRQAHRLNNPRDAVSRDLAADQLMILGHEVYGAPEKDLFDSALSEMWRQIDAKTFDERGQQIKAEPVNILPAPKSAEPIPMLDEEGFYYYREKLLERFALEYEIILSQWDKIQQKALESGTQLAFMPEDVYEVFKAINLSRGGEDRGVSVVMTDKSSYAYLPDRKVVEIGRKHIPIDTPLEMLASAVHEYDIHEGRNLTGEDSGVFVSATGHYDYLDFEDGFASVCEQIIEDRQAELTHVNLRHYINIGFAEGLGTDVPKDFRDVFEVSWRMRLLANHPEDKMITDEDIQEAKNIAYQNDVRRLFRGTTANMPGVIYTKDLVYLRGRIKATRHLAKHVGDDEEFDRLFSAKYDPTIDLQDRVVRKAHSS